MLKTFEYILKSRIEIAIDRQFPNDQQQGFQTSLGCLTASFNAQETILHNIENGSNVYSCFLDTSKAFDTVWRHGLLVKLYDLGVNGPLWSLICDSHTDTTSSVVVNHKQSRWFSVLQGVRQGGVTSTLLYLVFVNDLLCELETTNIGFGILDVTSNCPTLADDVMCIALSPNSLQSMLDVAYRYSKRWRFDFNAEKSCILCFRARGNRLPQQLTWSLGDVIVPCKDSYNHLGILINNKCSLTDRITLACEKGRKSYFTISSMLLSLVNPLTVSHLYKTVVRSSVLYGCELWNNITQQDSRRLCTFQHFVCKNAMGLPTRTRSDMAESMFDLIPIPAEIDTRKLLFLGRLCRLEEHLLPKKIFLIRLFSFIESLSNNQKGFIPDIVCLLHQYGLLDHLRNWLTNGIFPDKNARKRVVRATVLAKCSDARSARMAGDPEFFKFSSIFRCNSPASLWTLPSVSSEIVLCKFIAKLCTFVPSDVIEYCALCGRQFHDVFCHAVCTCPATFTRRELWWSCITNEFDLNLCADLCALPENELYHTLLGRDVAALNAFNEENLKNFRYVNFHFVRESCGIYYRTLHA